MKTGANTYKGLTSDIAYDSIAEGFYIDALDIRITTDTGGSQGAITNIKGNTSYFNLPVADADIGVNGTMEIIGATSIRNTIIIFCTDDSTKNGWIFSIDYSDIDQSLSALTLVHKNAAFYFSKLHPIEGVGRYESGCYKRIYWTDYNNYLRSLNIADANVLTIDIGLIDIFPNIKYVQPLLTNVLGGGTLLTGNNQYAYRLITDDGKETLVSPPGNMIHTVVDLESEAQTRAYNGNTQGVNSGKSHEITIDTSGYFQYKSIELIYILHDDPTGTPQVFSVEIKEINSAAEIVFLHTGTEDTITELELDTYTFKTYPFKTVKTLTQKDNSLVVANIKGSQFDVQVRLTELGESFDAKAPRYDSSPALESGKTALERAFNESYNKDAHWDKSWHDNDQYKFQADGLRLGGQGVNITYNFHLEPFLIDNHHDAEFANVNHIGNTLVDLNDGYGNYFNNTWDSNASPFISGLLKGYKRGETYRFGIIFYNTKGEASFVEYIGDIKFPDISDVDSVVNDSGTSYFPLSRETDATSFPVSVDTHAYAMGIEFNIDFTSCPNFLSEIESYQIVRLKRSISDSHRLCSGIMKVGMKFDITSDTGGGGLPSSGLPAGAYNLSGPSDSTNILHLFSEHQVRNASDGSAFLKGYGTNGTFVTINNRNIASDPFLAYGSYVAFSSPDISFDTEGVNAAINSNACLLMTGRYGQYHSSVNTPTAGSAVTFLNNADLETNQTKSFDIVHSAAATSENLGPLMEDHRRKLRSVGQVDKDTSTKAIEYIKKWKDLQRIEFSDNRQLDVQMQADLDRNLGPYLGFDDAGAGTSLYFRNFYTYLGHTLPGLNDHSDGGTTFRSIFHKGASGLIGSMERIEDDPLTSIPLGTFATTHYFDTGVGAGTGPVRAVVNEAPLNKSIGVENETSTPILDILIPRQEVYGGYSQDALENNFFMMASPVIDKANTNPKVYGGDIFLNMFVFQESTGFLWDKFYQNASTAGSSYQIFDKNRTSTISMVTESRNNLALSYGATTKTGVEFIVNGGGSGIQDEIWRQETNNIASTYAKKVIGTNHYNMYTDTYNAAYSIESDDLIFAVKPSLIDGACNVNDIRAYISNVKINEEKVDSWTKFGINNFYDIDDYGPINKILTWRDEVFYLQDKASGRYSINPRAVTSTSDGIPTELGSAEGFQDHTYISNKHGAIHQWAVIDTDRGIYYFDGIHKKLFKITDQNEPLSEVKGIHGFLRKFKGDISLRKENDGDNPIVGKGVHVTKDQVNNEILFTFLGTWSALELLDNTLYSQGDIVLEDGIYYEVTSTYTSGLDKYSTLLEQLQAFSEVTSITPEDKYTLVFDEIAQQFSSRYSAVPPIYIENGDILLSPDPNNKDHVFKHNAGNYGEFYGTKEECSITMVLNADANVNKILRFVEFNSIVRDGNENVTRDQTITGFRVTTEYQDTGKVLFSSGRIKRKFDKWRLKIPRDQNNGSTDRLRSSHFVLTLYFDNSYNRELILNKIIHHYDIQMF